MGYVKNIEHFQTLIEISINKMKEPKKALHMGFYTREVFSYNLGDLLTWQIRENPDLLSEDNILEWIGENRTAADYSYVAFTHHHTAEYIDYLKTLRHIPGVYIFSNSKKKVLYVGKSKNLMDRIPSSFLQRFGNFDRKIYLETIITLSISDACVIEVYMIGKLKPVFNSESKYNDEMTVEVSNHPPRSERILCNKIAKIKKPKRQTA